MTWGTWNTALLYCMMLPVLADKPLRSNAHEEPLPPGAILRLGTTHLRHAGLVRRVLFSQDSKTLLTAAGEEITLWDVATARKKAVFRSSLARGPSRGISSLALSVDGRLLAAASDGHLHVWDATTGRAVDSISLPRRAHVFAAAFRPDSKALAIGCHDGTILWVLKAGKEIQRFATVPLLTALSFSPNGKQLAASSRKPEIVRALPLPAKSSVTMRRPARNFPVWPRTSRAGRLVSLPGPFLPTARRWRRKETIASFGSGKCPSPNRVGR